MTGASGRPDDGTQATQIAELPAPERRALAALAIVGRASLSADELKELVEVNDVAPLVADLKRRGLIEGEERRRYSAVASVGEEIRKTEDALSTGERLLQYVTTLAKGGQLTPERLLDDAEAILGLSEWAAEMGQWEQLLELVKTVQAGFEIAHRVEELVTLLERGRSAARALDDWRSEVWMLQRLATASADAGDHAGAQRCLREADELISTKCQPVDGNGPGWKRKQIALRTLCAIAAAAAVAGGIIGWAIGDSNANANAGQTVTKTVTVPRTNSTTPAGNEGTSTGGTGTTPAGNGSTSTNGTGTTPEGNERTSTSSTGTTPEGKESTSTSGTSTTPEEKRTGTAPLPGE